MPNKITSVVGKIVSELEALSSEERKRAVTAAFAILGESDAPTTPAAVEGNPGTSSLGGANANGANDHGVSARGAAWIKKHTITTEQIEEAFHIDSGKVALILGKAIGGSKREQAVNTYILTGASALLESGNANFSDEIARQNCIQLGCYDQANHSKFLKEFGNRITGSKNAGWTLTAPGLTTAASLLKSHSNEKQ